MYAGSKEERAAFDIAYAHSRKSAYHDKFVIEEEGAITIDILPPSEDVTVGGDVNVEIKVSKVKVFFYMNSKVAFLPRSSMK